MVEQLIRDQNHVPVAGGVSNASATTVLPFKIDSITGRLLVDSAGGGTGTVTDVSVVTANGFAGTVANSTTTPAITLSTTITGILKGDGTAISAASSSTDYAALAFKTIAVSGQSDVVADSPIDTLTLVGGTGITITTNASTDTITFTASGGASGITIGTTTITSGTDTRVLFDNAGVVGEYVISGTGSVAMTTSPTFVTPTLGAASATTINKVTITTPAIGSTLTIVNGKTLTASVSMTLQGGDASVLSIAASKTATISNTLTFTGTDGSSVAFGTGGTVLYTTSTVPLTVGTTTIASGTNTKVLFDNSGVLGEYTISGSGNVAMTTSPVFTTPNIGAATATTINGNTFTTGTYTLTGTAGKTLNFTNTLTLSGTDSTTMTFPATSATVGGLGITQTWTSQNKFNNIIDVNNAVTVASNAGTVPVTFRLNTFTNSSAATMAITMATASAVDGQMTIVRIYDFSAVAQTIGWTNTENSTVSVPTTSNGSTTLPLTVGFMFNSATTKWRCIASA